MKMQTELRSKILKNEATSYGQFLYLSVEIKVKIYHRLTEICHGALYLNLCKTKCQVNKNFEKIKCYYRAINNAI